MSRTAREGLSAFAALCLLALTFALMLGFKLGLSALLALIQDVPLAEGSRRVAQSLLALTLVQLLAMAVVIALGLRLLGPEQSLFQTFRLRPIRLRSLAACLGAGACLQFPLAELANQLHQHVFGAEPIEEQLARQTLLEADGLLGGATVVVCIVALVPLAEELLFRGLLLFGMAERYGAAFAVLLSACLFGVLHFGAVPAVYATTAGLILGTLAFWTDSLWSSIALHAAVNAVPVLLPYHAVPIRGFNIPSESPQHLPLWLWLPPLCAGVALLFWVSHLEHPRRTHD